MIAAHWTVQQLCSHQTLEPMRYVCSNDTTQIKRACVECGHTFGVAERQANHPNHASYQQLERHPSPCDCHPRGSMNVELLRATVHDTTLPVDERRDAYDEYLRSPEWSQRRAYMIQRALNQCQMCSTKGGPNGAGLQVHHRTYRRLGHEFDADLIVLCADCHRDHHDRMQQRRERRETEAFRTAMDRRSAA